MHGVNSKTSVNPGHGYTAFLSTRPLLLDVERAIRTFKDAVPLLGNLPAFRSLRSAEAESNRLFAAY